MPAVCLPSRAVCKPDTSPMAWLCDDGGKVDGLFRISAHSRDTVPPPPSGTGGVAHTPSPRKNVELDAVPVVSSCPRVCVWVVGALPEIAESMPDRRVAKPVTSACA